MNTEALLTAIVKSSNDAIISKTLDSIITSWNPAAERIFGYTAEEAVGQSILMLIPPDLQDEETTIISNIRRGESIPHYETVRTRKDGTRIWVSITVSPVRDENQQIIGASKIARDITAQREAEHIGTIHTAIVNSSDDAIISKTLEGIITSWNPGAERIFGYSPDEILGKSITVLIPEERLSEENDIISNIKSGRRVEHFETVRKNKNGNDIYVSLTVSPVKDKKGQVIGASKIARNITEQVALQQQLKQYTTMLETSNQHKDQFISMASHELKTPITSAMANLQFLQRKLQDTDNQRLAGKALGGVIKLNKLVSDMLDISKIESGKLEMNFSSVDVHELLHETIENIQLTSLKHQIQYLNTHENPVITADRLRLEQVITNIINNAIKYSPDADKVIVHCYPENGKTVISVQDFGAGIPAEHHAKLFNRFYRIEEQSRNVSGLGIGLFITKQIIEEHQGHIWLESEAGKGTTFYVCL
ncbi:PAS domain-containing sensor histidine kinase [Mucilaginibacter sp. Bleaf8]|uniref:sensor histidine kinase n=1 Tax=Mucilaginibacter sp. Bleaf8 TaxID=2834430 RepID=UPI001BCEA035|nr:PAS domain-containing sensor histidine kinase [Mucilaginibacter sp. Bleaf8]MBS7564036.1 PAS domain-containing sensor histidine kinase [Mucilaginibacter sp. Bleaf8]